MLFNGDKAADIALGFDPKYSQVNIVGRNADIDIGSEDIWDGGGDYTTFPAAAVVHVSSSAVGDTTQSVTVVGLDAAGSPQTEVIALNGTTEVAGVLSFSAINSASLDATCAGDVYVYEDDAITAGVPNTATKVRSKIPIGATKTFNGFYTVPAGYDGLLCEYSGNATDLQLWSIASIGDPLTYEENLPGARQAPKALPSGTFVKLRNTAIAANQDVRASMMIMLRRK